VFQSDGSETYLLDRLADKTRGDYLCEDKITIKEIIKNLSARERQIIALRYFDDKTQTQIAQAMGISQVQVSRLEKKILESIKEQMK